MEDKNLSLVVLAAGKGTRFLPLTTTTPKPLLKIAGKSPIEYTFEAVFDHINEIVLVVGYLADEFKQFFGADYKGIPIKYVEQTEQRGTAHAVNSAKEAISNDRFLLVYGDDLYDTQVFESIWDKNLAVVGMFEENWQNFGILKPKGDNLLEEIVEKPQGFISNLANIGVYLLNKDIFKYFDKVEDSVRGELEFTDMMTQFAKEHDIYLIEIKSGWCPLSYPWNLLQANKKKMPEIESEVLGEVEPGAVVKGKLKLGKGSVIKSGSYLEGDFIIGENCIIGPSCSLKNFAQIGDECEIGAFVQVNRSIIGNSTKIKHLSYIGDSILGNSVNIGAGTVTANLRHDKATIRVMNNNTLIDSGVRKLGALIGDNAKTAINTSLYPGVKLPVGSTTLPGEVVSKDKA